MSSFVRGYAAWVEWVVSGRKTPTEEYVATAGVDLLLVGQVHALRRLCVHVCLQDDLNLLFSLHNVTVFLRFLSQWTSGIVPESDKLWNRFPYVTYVKKPSEDTDRIIFFPCRVSSRNSLCDFLLQAPPDERDIAYADALEWIAEFKVPQRRLDIENVVSLLSTVHIIFSASVVH